MMKAIYAITLEPEEVGSLAAVLRDFHPDYQLVASLSDAPESLSERYAAHAWDLLELSKEPLSRLVGGHWPESVEQAAQVMSLAPKNLTHWKLKNLLWQFSTGGFLYWANEHTLKQQDITVHLTVARMFGQFSGAILGADMRSVVDVTQMTLTDVCVGEADKRTLSLLLENLDKETTMAPDAEGPTD